MWKCKKCGGTHTIVEEVKLVQRFSLDKELKQVRMVATGGYGGEYEECNRLYKCDYCGVEQFNDIKNIAEWIEGDNND